MAEDKSPDSVGLLKQVCDIMKDYDLGSVYLREGDITLRITAQPNGTSMPPALGVQPGPSVLPQTVGLASPSAPLTESPQESGELIKSPMVGIFYRAADIDKPPFVEVGDSVLQDDDLCLIEAMKIFNPVLAPFPCEIVEILVENETAVEYDQPLFRIKRI